jgi:hypothetical protein
MKFRGYEEFGFRRLSKIAKSPSPNDLSELRGALFFGSRARRHCTLTGAPPSKKELEQDWWPLVELIRRYLRKHPPKHAFHRLTMERTMCYGKCPVYKVSVDAKGSVRWSGEMHVKKIGRAAWRIGWQEIDRLRALLRDKKFGSFRKSYSQLGATDQADCITTVQYSDGSKKRVHHYLGDPGAPAELERLEDEVDRILGTRRFNGPRWRSTRGLGKHGK